MAQDREIELRNAAARRDRGNRPRVTLDLPADVVLRFKAMGRGWKTRMVEVLEREARHG